MHAALPLAAPFGVAPGVARRAGLAALAIDLAALASARRGRAHAVGAKFVWTVVVALPPLPGAAEFALGRGRRARPTLA